MENSKKEKCHHDFVAAVLSSCCETYVMNSGVVWLKYCHLPRPHHGVRLLVRLRPLLVARPH